MEPTFGSSFFELASSRPVVRRALGYALIVGAVLVAINHGGAILRGEIDPERWWKMGLTVLVPYAVSTLSSVQAMRDNARPGAGGGRPNPAAAAD